MKGSFKLVWIICIICLVTACNTAGPGVFGKKHLHEQYASKLTEAGLKETAMGAQWFEAANRALAQPADITLPYKEAGYFAAEAPRAVGLQFSGKRGQKLLFQLEKNALKPFVIYTDLWRVEAAAAPKLIKSIDTSQQSFELEVEDNEVYILRLQPELLRSGDYTLSISLSAVLGFPVAGNNARIGSVWGDARDAGGRRHEGIDIFAPKRTPVVAAYDGTVTRVNENNLGGKVVWMRPHAKNYTLYYAHLDEQLATDGQRVEKGDTLGLIGNTGNARTTPPHLHFGIYAAGGAIDPLPFVDPAVKKPAAADFNKEALQQGIRLSAATALSTSNYTDTYAAQTVLYPVAATATHYRVRLPDNTELTVARNAVQSATNPIKKVKLGDSTILLDSPFDNAAKKQVLASASTVGVIGYYKNFALVRQEATEGWLHLNKVQ